jgi:hypothetical membrane protein
MLPVFDKVKAAAAASALVGAIVAAIVGVFPPAAEYSELIAIMVDGTIGAVVMGAVTFIAGWLKTETAVAVEEKV